MTGGELRRRRIGKAAAVFGGVGALLFGRAVWLTVIEGPTYAASAAKQHRKTVSLVPHRGAILDRDGAQLALSVDVPSIFVRRKAFAGHEGRLRELAKTLGVPLASLEKKLAGTQSFVWLKRQASPQQAEAVARLAIPGVGSEPEPRRFYPHGALASQVIGVVDVDAKGISGTEKAFDKSIRGTPVTIEVEQDAKGRQFYRQGVGVEPPRGGHVELTIDVDIQQIAEKALVTGVEAAGAASGTAIVLDPRTGEILALATRPTFNPNDRSYADRKGWQALLRNRAITDPYEPGSTFKAILAAAAIEERIVTPEERFFCENGTYQVGKWPIRDAHPHGWLSFSEVIQVSSNICAIKVGERLGRDRYYAYLRAFGFGARTGVELPLEEPGILRPGDKWARIDLAVQSFGQGIAVTPLQLASAIGAIANHGELMRPYIVRRVVGPDGQEIESHQPTLLRRVVSERAARTTTELLRRVVEEEGGTGGRARLDDFSVAGKTGTSEKADPKGRGYSAKRIGSFVGFVPADDPRIVVLVMIDEPTKAKYGGVVAAPVFREIATGALKVLGVTAPAPPSLPPIQAVRAPAPALVPEPARSGVPSLLGLSLRDAITRAHAAGWAVRATGSGYVASQKPAAGVPLGPDRRLALVLDPDRGTAVP